MTRRISQEQKNDSQASYGSGDNASRLSKTYRNREDIGRPPQRLVRFALLAADGANLPELRDQIDLCLATTASEYLPDLLPVDESFWNYHAKFGRRWSPQEDEKGHQERPPYLVDDKTLTERREAAKNRRPPGIPFRLEPFLSERQRRPPKLAPELVRYNFLLLTLPLYEADYRREQCNPSGALFDVAYILQRCARLRSVTPDLEYPNFELFSSFGGCPCPERTNIDWHLDNINYSAVPDTFTGAGFVIGHPDTGWTPHSELNFTDADGNLASPNFVPGTDVNIIDPNAASAEERVPSPPGFLRQRYHGTRTAGLLVSDAESGALDGSEDRVRGIARGATVVSIRCVDGVILIADINVAQAVLAAVSAGVHVISISLGGYPAPVLEWAIQWAVANNVIVVAAAGNYWPFVVYPAAYPACIGVGGSTIDDEVWSGSSRNYQLLMPVPIDISAPAECVWNPTWRDDGAETAGRASGTSFATAIVAGAAALWLQRHNRNFLLTALNGRAPLQELFRAHLAATARRPSGWNTILDGPGILDLQGLMDPTTLPDPSTFNAGTALLGRLTGPFGLNGPPRWLEAMFDPETASEFGNELMTIFMSNPVVAAGMQSIAQALSAGQEVADAIATGAQDAVESAQQFLEDTVEEIAEAVEEVVNTVTEAASNAASKATKAASKAASTVAGWFGL